MKHNLACIFGLAIGVVILSLPTIAAVHFDLIGLVVCTIPAIPFAIWSSFKVYRSLYVEEKKV